MKRSTRRGFTLSDLLVTLTIAAVAVAMILPLLGAAGGVSGLSNSLANLAAQGAGHAMYAADWDGRQVTQIVDDISSFGDDADEAFSNYENQVGEHPSVVLGWGCDDDGNCIVWQYRMTPFLSGNYVLAQPIVFDGFTEYLGAFRNQNTRPFHFYAGRGRFYDPVFYAPRDTAVWEITKPAFQEKAEWVFVEGVSQAYGDIPAWSSYCLSPAALFHPDVMGANDADGAWRDPWSIDHGFETPGLFQARHPSLKTHALEHHWNQNRPAEFCNPGFDPGTYNGCEPYYFNHGLDSAPATLFYDLSVRTLPNQEAIAADELIKKMSGRGLWSRTTPWGASGYLSEYAYDDTLTSHHVLTNDGILGRDTIATK